MLKFASILAVFCSFSICATAMATQFEVVQSTPIETSLAVPGIPTTQQVWLNMINGAQRTIDFEHFYINNQPGQSLAPVIAAIKAAAARGVQIRFLVDQSYYANYSAGPNDLAQTPNVQVKTISFAPGIQHSKYFVVDQNDSIVGSANFDWLALTHIHEVSLHVIDPSIAANLESIFNQDWAGGSNNLSAEFKPKPHAVQGQPQPDGFEVIASPQQDNPQGISDTLTGLVNLIGDAKQSLKIQMYEYTTAIYQSTQTFPVLDQAIRQAAARGVHVQLLFDATAMKAGSKNIQALAAMHGNIEVRIITIPQWSGGPIPYARVAHSKYLVLDGIMGWVGSENWSSDYFENSRNVGIAFQSAAVATNLGQIFDTAWNSPYVSAP